MKIVLSGATGFIGKCVYQQLLSRGDEVHTVGRSDSSGIGDSKTPEIVSSDPFMKERILAFSPDVVIHLATKFQAQHSFESIADLVESNVTFGTRLMDSATECEARFVTVSTAWQHFEGARFSPVNLYAATKQALDDIAVYYASEGLRISRLTLFDTYGPKDPRSKLIHLLMKAAYTGSPLAASSGHQLIDLTYVDDVAQAIVDVATNFRGPEPVDSVVRSGALPVREVASILSQAIGCRVPVNWGAVPDRPREMYSDWEFGQLLDGWMPQTSLRAGLLRTWDEDWQSHV